MKRTFALISLCLVTLLFLTACRGEERNIRGDAKPVIYLYSEEEMEVAVRLDYDGDLTCTYPAYDGGWTVTAQPGGILTDAEDRTYNYLYWEGVTSTEYDFSQGFCVPGKDTAAFLEDALARLGLTRREANEFIVYWLPRMEDNAYNLISFQSESYTGHAKLTIDPQPDSLLRVFMAWRPLTEPVEIPEQELPAFNRTGFAAVEWGGAELRYLTKQEAEQLIASHGTMTVAEEETTLELPFALQRTVTLSRYDGETVSSAYVYETLWPEKTALQKAFNPIKGRAVTNWAVPENPWPVYTLRISGGGRTDDYEALYCRGVWLDNRGNTLLADVDFPALWKQFAKDAKATQAPPHALPLLALRDGRWNHWFMTPSQAENLNRELYMILDTSGENLSWTVSNGTGTPLSHPNGGGAWLEVSLAGWWYTVPLARAMTTELHTLLPNKSYTSTFAREYYANLPDGSYRLVFPLYTSSQDPQDMSFYGYSAASFRLKDGIPVLPGA